MEVLSDLKTSKNINKFYCNSCDFGCSKKGDWTRHIARPKHINIAKCDTQVTKKTYIYICELCDKKYSSRNGLWKHKQICNVKNEIEEDKKEDDEMMYNGINIKDKDALVLHLLQENSKLTNKIIEMAPQSSITNNTNNSNSHNTNNNNFNLNFFLNETCKNAMNISDFVSSIKMDLDDLEHVGRTSYIEGISNIVVKNLNNLEQQLRPLHCSDSKREVLYIKDNDEWTKETDSKPILTNTIKIIANQNIKQINNWVKEHPDCIKSNSRKNDLYLKIVSNSMNGLTKEEGDKNINKIISNVAKKVTINK